MGTILWPIDKILLLIFIVLATMSITLQATLGDIAEELHNKTLVMRAFVVNFVLVPILGMTLVKLLPLSPDVEKGILLLAVAPGGVMAINFTRQLCARIELAAALLFLLTFSGIPLSPILAEWLIQSELLVYMPYGKVVKVLLVYIALPLIAGLALKKSVPKLAAASRKPVNIISGVAFVAFSITTASLKSSAAKAIAGGGTLIALILLLVGAMMLGWFFAGSDPENRRVLSVNTGMRSLAVCLAIATHPFADTNVDLTILAFAAFGIPITFFFTLYQKRKIKKLLEPHAVSAA